MAENDDKRGTRTVTVRATPVAAIVGSEGVDLVCVGEVVSDTSDDKGKGKGKMFSGIGPGKWGNKNGGGSTPAA